MISAIPVSDIDIVKRLWKQLFDDSVEERPKGFVDKDQWTADSLQRLRAFSKNFILLIPDGQWDISCMYNTVWFQGRVDDLEWKLHWKDKYPALKFEWSVSMLIATVPVIFMKKSLLDKTNAPISKTTKPMRDHEVQRMVDKRYPPDHCYKWSMWNPLFWDRNAPQINPFLSDISRGFLDGKLISPSIHFESFPDSDILFTPVLPVDIPEYVFSMKKWGIFREETKIKIEKPKDSCSTLKSTTETAVVNA